MAVAAASGTTSARSRSRIVAGPAALPPVSQAQHEHEEQAVKCVVEQCDETGVHEVHVEAATPTHLVKGTIRLCDPHRDVLTARPSPGEWSIGR